MTKPAQPTAPNQRSFALNSDEAYQALCAPEARPWIMNGSLPREPRAREGTVIVEVSAKHRD
jgi:hypothetical protein